MGNIMSTRCFYIYAPILNYTNEVYTMQHNPLLHKGLRSYPAIFHIGTSSIITGGAYNNSTSRHIINVQPA
jgi:hypothetical protein